MSEPRGPEDPTNRWIAGKIDELLQGLHPEDEALVLEYLGLNKLDSGTIDPPPVRRAMGTDPSRETLSKKKSYANEGR